VSSRHRWAISGGAVAGIFTVMRETAINNTIDGDMKMARIPIVGNQGQHEQQDNGASTKNTGSWDFGNDDRSMSLRFHFGQ